MELAPLPTGGSVVFPEATGHLPGLKGRLNTIRDVHDRTYLYASTSPSTKASRSPFIRPRRRFASDRRDGAELLARILDVVGRSALIEFRTVGSADESGTR